MKKKKISLAMLGITLASIGALIPVGANAWGGATGPDAELSASKIKFNKNGTSRPVQGYFKRSQTWNKNPFYPSLYYGNGKTYKRGQDKIQSNKLSAYGWTIYFYEPYADENGNKYTSPQYDAVLENRYSVFKDEGRGHYIAPNFKDISLTVDGVKYPNVNFSSKENMPNTSYNTKTYYKNTTNQDDKLKKNGQWRFIGYNMAGNVIENPFFPPDTYTNSHKSEQNFIYLGIHSNGNGIGPDLPTSPYDNEAYYSDKIKAIERLQKKDAKFKSGKALKVTNSNKLDKWKIGTFNAENWAECLSLLTHPTLETPQFNGFRIRQELGENFDNDFKTYSSIVAPATELEAELNLTKMIVKDSKGNIVGRFNRNNTATAGGNYNNYNHAIIPGNTYTVEYEVYNNSTKAVSKVPAGLDVGASKNKYALVNGDEEKRFDQNYKHHNKTLNSIESNIPAKGTATFKHKIKVDEDAKSGFRVTGFISEKHYGIDNLNTKNDWGKVVFNKVAFGDFAVNDIYLEDANGKKVENMIPGKDYKVVYDFKYNGPDKESKYDLAFTGNVKRYLPDNTTEVKQYNFNINNAVLTNGKSFKFKSDLITFEVPKFDAMAQVKIENETINANKENDKAEKKYEDLYDLSVHNVRVIPKDERPVKDGFITIGIKYDVHLKTPEHIPYFETDVNNKVTVTKQNGEKIDLSFTDHINKGWTKDIVHELKIPVNKISSGSEKLPIEVMINYDKKKWEEDITSQSNNKGNTNMTILPPYNPNNIGTPEQLNGCPTDNKPSNKWNITQKESKYNGVNKTYQNFAGNKNFNFYDYNTQQTQKDIEGYYNESLNIDYVNFKSKYTTEKNYGKNGWVDLVTQSELARVKAGYGYQLEMQVTYKTDVFDKQAKPFVNKNSGSISGTSLSNYQTPANIHNDIYVATKDGKILSATGMYGTIQAFDSTVISHTDSKTVIKYTMKNRKNGSVNEPMKIYIGEDVKDGLQPLTIFTPSLKGVGTTATKENDICSSLTSKFQVKGSMYDDYNDHIVQ